MAVRLKTVHAVPVCMSDVQKEKLNAGNRAKDRYSV